MSERLKQYWANKVSRESVNPLVEMIVRTRMENVLREEEKAGISPTKDFNTRAMGLIGNILLLSAIGGGIGGGISAGNASIAGGDKYDGALAGSALGLGAGIMLNLVGSSAGRVKPLLSKKEALKSKRSKAARYLVPGYAGYAGARESKYDNAAIARGLNKPFSLLVHEYSPSFDEVEDLVGTKPKGQ
jgi:hypothetical protein